MALLECCNVTMGYDRKMVFENLSFRVNKGDYLCIVGENGSGKTTLIKGITGLLNPMSGTIRTGEGLKQNEIGYLPQQSDAQRNFPASVMEVVISGCLNRLGKRIIYGKEAKEKAADIMDKLSIGHLKRKSYGELSGGQQQRALLARALCATEKMILLDEPTAGLDPVVTEEMYSLIRDLNRESEMTVVMITHDVDEALKYATHILHIGHKDYFYGNVKDYCNRQADSIRMGGDGL